MEHLASNNDQTETIAIVGIRASSGGIEAIIEFFDCLKSNLITSFTIIQRLSQDYKTVIPQFLAKLTKMTIHKAQENVVINVDQIYVIPANKNLTLKNGIF